jgi:hypothetical protein
MGSATILECPMDFLNAYQRDNIVPIMIALEKEFKCAGICEDPKYFIFS